ncbi:sulfate/molybdate ABC transporter ATP-binding protein [Methanosphaerula subterraneus]|uniref:sulfate/molybdate ABC transporter ATP-binding protein n=1 Tax=Methanosphaerula subterraneus TaxID=3350244 RepID=UPI003F840652
MLECTVTKQLRSFTLNVGFQAPAGCITALMGENGAGKTTIFHLIAGLLSPDNGRISLGESLLFDGGSEYCAPVCARRIGYITQKTSVFPHMTVFENVAYGLRSLGYSRAEIRSQVTGWLSKLEIADLAGVKAGNLSGGQQQRVAIARAFAIHPALLLLDEPYESLDAHSRSLLTTVVRGYVQEHQIPCLCVTHHVEEAKTLCDRVLMIERGELVWRGSPSDLEGGCTCPSAITLQSGSSGIRPR